MLARYELPATLLAAVVVAMIGISGALAPETVIGDGVDAYGTLWFFWWVQHCITTLSDPGFTDWFFYPLGKDIFAHTGNNILDAVIAAPLFWLFGNPGYQKVWVALLVIGNALSFRVLAKGLFKDPMASFGATLAWTMNPYILFEITCGRPTQAFLWFLPLAVHHMLRAEEDDRWRHPVLAGVFTGLQAWTYWFMGWFMAFLFVGVAAYALWKSTDRRRLLIRYAVAGVACLAVVLPAAIPMALAASEGAVPGLSDAPVDIFSPPPQLANNVSAALHGYVMAEFDGAPQLLSWAWIPWLLVWFVLGKDRSRWLPAFLFIWLMSIGPVLEIPEGPQIVMPHYMAAYHLLPAFDRLWFPYRMLSVLFLVLCIGIGGVLQRASLTRFARFVPVVLGLFAIGTALEQNKYGIYPFVTKAVSAPEWVDIVAEHGGHVIHMPFGISQPAIYWQTLHEQKMLGGMGENARIMWPEGFKGRMSNSFVHALVETARDPGEEQRYSATQRERFEAEGFRWLILHRDLAQLDVVKWVKRRMDGAQRIEAVHEVTRGYVDILGDPVSVQGEFVMWDLTGELPTVSPPELYEKTWSEPEGTAYERALKENGRLSGEGGGGKPAPEGEP